MFYNKHQWPVEKHVIRFSLNVNGLGKIIVVQFSLNTITLRKNM